MNRAEFADMVGRELELLPAGQTLEAEFRTVIDGVYDARWAYLVKRKLAYFPKDDIPNEASHPLAIYIAGYAAGQLLDAQGKAEKMAMVPQAERDLRSLAGEKNVRKKVWASYF